MEKDQSTTPKEGQDFADQLSHKPHTTLYGEFVCSAYQWLPLDKQKENTKKLENMTKKKK